MGARPTDAPAAERYVRGELLGRGAFGLVWRAHDTLLERDVAIKEIHFPSSLDDAQRAALRDKVLREARAAAGIGHPGLVTVFDVFEDGDCPLIVMELVDAPTLAELVELDGPLDEAKAAEIGLQVLDVLSAAHARGIIHRDVKPANVMVCRSGRVQLADFGIAALSGDPLITGTGRIAGSPSYMAPEQAENRPPTAATDLWGLGATLYFAVEGAPPFEKPGAIATLTSVVSEPPRPLSRAYALAPLLRDLLAKEPSARPPVGDVRRRLLDVAPRSAPASTDPSPTQQLTAAPQWGPPLPARRPRRRPVRWLVAAMALLVAAAAIVIVLTQRPRTSSTATSKSTTRSTTARTRSSNANVPAGWTSYTDPSTGFTIAYPSTWQVQRSGTLTNFRDPASGAYLRVDHQQPPGPSPAGAWQALEPQFAAGYPSYHRIQITPTTFQGDLAAIWEFTYSDGGADLHAVDLGFVTGNYGFALNFQTHAQDWASMQSTFDRFKSSFKAPS